MYEFFINHLYWFWLIVMVICIAIEAGTLSLTTVWAAISAFIMIFLSLTHLPLKWQIVLFFLMTIAMIIFTRPFVMNKLHLGKNKTNVNTLEGQEVLVTKTVSKFQKGEAKAKNGVIWTVTSDEDGDIPENTICVVTHVDGNTLKIKPKN